ncbi:oxidoreductase, short chain dehydrogenase/reductase family protein [delta proteobacterium NaphS2]|nr:oxidoreductase, short chain dehydrogenase/reductase family protein [delta proteobacterium NaphS2]
MRLKDKVIIITGAGQGLGAMYAHKLAEEGAKITIADINEEKARKVADDINAKGYEAIAIRTDVSNEQSTEALAKLVSERYGHIDVLVNNASIFATIKMKPFNEISVKEWDNLMGVNLRGVFLCCKAVIPFMKKKKMGKVINISSSTVFMGRPYYLHYVTSKAGVIGFTRALAKELGEWNINVNCVTPGGTKTEIPRDTVSPEQFQALINQQCIKRQEVPEDLVGAIIFLSSDESTFISGQTINVDGGLNLH